MFCIPIIVVWASFYYKIQLSLRGGGGELWSQSNLSANYMFWKMRRNSCFSMRRRHLYNRDIHSLRSTHPHSFSVFTCPFVGWSVGRSVMISQIGRKVSLPTLFWCNNASIGKIVWNLFLLYLPIILSILGVIRIFGSRFFLSTSEPFCHFS